MILSFKTKFKDGSPTYFKERIDMSFGERQDHVTGLRFTKIHSIIKGNRWSPGMKIHFATGVRTKNYNNWRVSECVNTQDIFMTYSGRNGLEVSIDDDYYSLPYYLFELARNDGFESLEVFEEWFISECKKDPHGCFSGQIIHWTNKLYGKEADGE